MMEYARLGIGPELETVRAGFYYFQRLVQFYPARRMIGSIIAKKIRLSQPMSKTHKEVENHAAAWRRASAELYEDGVAVLPRFLSRPHLDDIEGFLSKAPVSGPGSSLIALRDTPPGTGFAPYPLETVLSCPHILDIANRPEIISVIADYLGCKPTLSSIGLRWSLPTADGRHDVQNYHRDPDDWRSLKLFVYLTDVTDGSGPHIYVKGSHRTTGSIKARSLRREDIVRRYGESSLFTVLGEKGTCFLADVHGIHKGRVPESAPRLMLQIQYSLLPVYAFRYRPLSLSKPPGLDPYINRLLLA